MLLASGQGGRAIYTCPGGASWANCYLLGGEGVPPIIFQCPWFDAMSALAVASSADWDELLPSILNGPRPCSGRGVVLWSFDLEDAVFVAEIDTIFVLVMLEGSAFQLLQRLLRVS